MSESREDPRQWSLSLGEKCVVRVEDRSRYLIIRQTGAPQTLTEAERLQEYVTSIVSDTDVHDVVLDHREADRASLVVGRAMRSYYGRNGPFRDVALVLTSGSDRLDVNSQEARSTGNNVRAFSTDLAAEHWLTGWRSWDQASTCLFELDGSLFAIAVEEVEEIIPYGSPLPLPGLRDGAAGILRSRNRVLLVLHHPLGRMVAPAGGPPHRLLVAGDVAIPATRTALVGEIHVCDPLHHGASVRSSVGSLCWVDARALQGTASR